MSSESGVVRRRVAELDRLPAPDLWDEIERRAPATLEEETADQQRGTWRVRSIVAAVAAVVVAFAGGVWLSRANSEHHTINVASGGSAADRSWSQVAAFPAEPENPGSAWLVAGDSSGVVAAFARDRRIRLFDADRTAAPRLISTPPVVAVASSDGVPIMLAQDGRLLVIDHNAPREIAHLSSVEKGAQLAVANGHVWVARGGSSPLAVVDLATGVVDEVDALRGVDVISAYGGHVWATSAASRRIVLLDALDRRVLAQRDLAGVIAIEPGARGDAWVLRSNGAEGELLHLDADMNASQHQAMPSTTSDIEITDGSLWSLDRGRLTRTVIGEQKPAQIMSIGATVGRLALGRDVLYVFGSDVRVLRSVGAG